MGRQPPKAGVESRPVSELGFSEKVTRYRTGMEARETKEVFLDAKIDGWKWIDALETKVDVDLKSLRDGIFTSPESTGSYEDKRIFERIFDEAFQKDLDTFLNNINVDKSDPDSLEEEFEMMKNKLDFSSK